MSVKFVKVCEIEGDDAVELPTEENGSLSLCTLVSQFPGASSLKYRISDKSLYRGVRVKDDHLFPITNEGWGSFEYVCVFANRNKRKRTEEDTPSTSSEKNAHMVPSQDLIVLGVKYTTTEEKLRKYFQNFGEVTYAVIKRDKNTNLSKGYAFIRFASFQSQFSVLNSQHWIDDRLCTVKMPEGKHNNTAHKQESRNHPETNYYANYKLLPNTMPTAPIGPKQNYQISPSTSSQFVGPLLQNSNLLRNPRGVRPNKKAKNSYLKYTEF